MKTSLNLNQFSTFLLIYAAHVDYQYVDEEENYIKAQTDSQTYDEMFALFEDTSDYKCLKIILEHKQVYYENLSYQKEIRKKVIELLNVDGEYSRPEKVFIDFLSRMLEAEK